MLRKFTLGLAILVYSSISFAQLCAPDTFSLPGIYPDSLEVTVDTETFYDDTITVVIPADTLVDDPLLGGRPCDVNTFALESVGGIPPSFGFSCSPLDCVFPAETSGCVYIFGDPSTAGAGVYPLSVNVRANLTCYLFGSSLFPITIDTLSTIEDYSIVIESGSSCDNSVPPQNLNSTQLPSGAYELTWDPIANSVGCQVSLTLPTGATVNQNVLSPEASSFTAPAGPLSSFVGQDISWKVRCACQISPTIIATGFSVTETFTVMSPRLGNTVADVSLYPNPANDIINIVYNTDFSGDVNVAIYDIVGRNVANFTTSVVNGSNTLQHDISDLSPGTYIVEVMNGTEKLVQKFTKSE